MPKPKPVKTRRRFTTQEKHGLVIRLRTRPSNETIKAFAAKHGVTPGVLHYWNNDPRFASNDPVGEARSVRKNTGKRGPGRPKGSQNGVSQGNDRLVQAEQELEVLRLMVELAFAQGFLKLSNRMHFLQGGPR
jgi:transposase-like protein